ncbi:hypothetical protein LSH36_848g00063 [Paralvinella palmiformis]|uniref:Alpha-catulin n=1 Tax=Paralvinella palmiformis TaxID=53620 RepID=A0AAD9IZD7_9ANNE|nr:hypothetical protein LSH36_848g00063 [Paralvinella palmiformis]
MPVVTYRLALVITTLVNAKERPIKSEKTLRALVRVGQAVNLAVERFVTVGEAIADENPEIRDDMSEACREARLAGVNIQALTDVKLDDPHSKTTAEKTAMVRAARQLLSAITKVLILADKVVIKQLLAAKDKVLVSLNKIETCTTFTEFVKSFIQFGNEMVELAHLSGDRQNDLKNEKTRAQIGAARCILEKSTMMLLTTSKTLLRHPECESARQNRDGVFMLMRKALDNVHHIVTDGGPSSGDLSPTMTVNGDSGISLAQHQPTAHKALKEFEDLVEMTRVTLVGPNTENKLQGALDTVMETTQDFTDSAYTSHENRERILLVSDRLRQELQLLLQIGVSLDQKDNISPNQELETAILRTRESSDALKKQLQDTAMDQASDVFKTNEDHELLTALKNAGFQGERDRIAELSVKFEEHSEQLQEVCKLLKHIAGTEPLSIWSEHTESSLKTLAPLLIFSAHTLAGYPASKIAKENLDVFADAWASQINDLSVLVKDINDVNQGRIERQVYLSLPRPGEQAKIAKLGLEMKLITSEMDAETDKWEEPDNEIVRRAKNMSSMAFSMYLFTRGEGPLKTTQDLFTQAEYFAEEGAKLFKTVKDFINLVPAGIHKTELIAHLDRLPVLCQQLSFTIKSPTMGKAATFNKVDSVIQETKNLMNSVAKVVTTCLVCTTKYNIELRGHLHMSHSSSRGWRHAAQMDFPTNGGTSDGSDRDSVKSGSGSGSGRSESFRRSSSLTSRPMSSLNAYDRS